MAFTTKLDFSSNRQVKQHIETFTVLSGGTSFGVPFSSLPSGPNLLTSGITNDYTAIVSTFSGNNITTNYNWYDTRMSIAEPYLSAITPSTSAITQEIDGVFAPNNFTYIDGNLVNLDYSGVSFDLFTLAMTDLGGGDYSGTVETTLLNILSASTLDFTGRTIWADVSGITRTDRLIVTNNPQVGHVLTCIDTEGMVAFLPSSGGSSGLTSNIWVAGTGIASAVLSGSGGIASGDYSISEGLSNTATGFTAHAEGAANFASGDYSHAEGKGVTSSGAGSHAEGNNTTASGNTSHAEGAQTIAGGDYSHAEGNYSVAGGDSSHAEGGYTIATGASSHAEGYQTQALSDASHAEGYNTIADGMFSHAEGQSTYAGVNSHAEGNQTYATATSHAEGYQTSAMTQFCHAEGFGTLASGNQSHAEGNGTIANGDSSHAEGVGSIASGGRAAHAEGYGSIASGDTAHAQGAGSIAGGTASHAEGSNTRALGDSSHAEGYGTIANNFTAHAGGYQSTASGQHSFVHGSGSTASGFSTIVLGSGISGSADNTTYVDNFNIKNVGAGPGVTDLGVDANGFVVDQASDINLKENINTIQNALQTVLELRGVTYNWKDRNKGGNALKLGFIAQEVDAVIPELAYTNNVHGYMGVHYKDITALLVEAVKELANGVITSNNTHLETQTILAEDNNIDLNYNGNNSSAVGGGITVLHAKKDGESSEIITDENGDWITNNDFKPLALTIPYYTPTSSEDLIGREGNLTRDNDYLYIKTISGWKRTNLENF